MKIPQAQSAGLVNTNVRAMPTQSIENAGMVQRATAQAFGQAADISNKFASAIREEEAKDFLNKAQINYTMQADAEYNKLITDERYQKTPEAFTQVFKGNLDKYKSDILKNAPNSSAARLAKQSLQGLDYNYARQASGFERNQKLHNLTQSKMQTVDVISNSIITGFNPANVNDFKNKKAMLRSQFEAGNLYTSEESSKYVSAVDKKLFTSMIDHYSANPMGIDGSDTSYVETALDILEGRRPDSSQILEGVPSEMVGDAILKLNRIKEMNQSVGAGRINAKISDIQAAIENGDYPPSEKFAEIMGLVSDKQSNAPELRDTVQALESISNNFKSFVEASPEQKMMMAKQPLTLSEQQDKTFNASGRQQLNDFYNKGLQKLVTDMGQRGADYAIKARPELSTLANKVLDFNSPDLKKNVTDYVTASETIQKSIGIAKPRLTTNDQIKTLATILNSEVGQNSAKILDNVANAYGDKTGQLVDELITHGKMKPDIIPALMVSDTNSRQQLLDNLRNKTHIIQQKPEEARKADFEDIRNDKDVKSFLDTIGKTDKAGNNRAIVNAFAEQVELEYKRLMSDGKSSSEAKKQAKRFITDNFEIVPDAGAVIIPKKLNVTAKEVRNFMNNATSFSSPFYDSAQIKLPPKLQEDANKEPDRFDTITKNYRRQIADNAVWIWDGGEGASLYIDGGGAYTPVMNKMNEPVYMKYKDMPTYKMEKNVVADTWTNNMNRMREGLDGKL